MAERTVTLNVSGMDCGGCETSIGNALGALDGVKDTTASHAEGRVEVRFDDGLVDLVAISQAIEDAGYTVEA